MALLTPGHTPDSLCVYDPEERTLFVGDTLHENTAVTFPAQGNVQAYVASLDKLLALVYSEGGRVKLAGGRGVWDVDAVTLLGFAKRMMKKILKGELKAESKGESRGFKIVQYDEQKVGYFGPELVFEAGRKALGYLRGPGATPPGITTAPGATAAPKDTVPQRTGVGIGVGLGGLGIGLSLGVRK